MKFERITFVGIFDPHKKQMPLRDSGTNRKGDYWIVKIDCVLSPWGVLGIGDEIISIVDNAKLAKHFTINPQEEYCSKCNRKFREIYG